MRSISQSLQSTFNCDAALDLLAKTPPNIQEACAALEAIASDSVRREYE